MAIPLDSMYKRESHWKCDSVFEMIKCIVFHSGEQKCLESQELFQNLRFPQFLPCTGSLTSVGGKIIDKACDKNWPFNEKNQQNI